MNDASPAPSPADEPAATRATRGVFALAAVLSVIAAVRASDDAMFFVNDGPQHLYASVAALGIDEARAFDRFVTANLSPTDRGVTDVIQTLTPFLGWKAAYKAAVTLTVLAWAWGFFALALTLAPRRAAVGLLGFALAFQTPLFLGLLPFVLGSGLALLGAAAFLSSRPHRTRLVAAVLAFACAAHVHVVAAAIGGAILAAAALAPTSSRTARVRELAVVGAWPTLVLVVVWWMSRDLDAGLVDEPTASLPARMRALPSLWLLGGLEGLVLAGVAAACAPWLSREARAGAPRSSVALVACGALLLAFSIVTPSALSGWGGAGDRAIPFGFACVLLAAPLEALRSRARAVAHVVVLAFIVVALGRVWQVQSHIRALHAPLLAALETFEPSPRFWYGIATRATGAHADAIPAPLEPAVHAPQLAALALGGVVEESHTSSRALHVALLRPEVARAPSSDPLGGNYFPMLTGDEQTDLALVPRVAGLAAPFDGLLLYGPAPMPTVRAAFSRFGFRTLAEAGGLSVLVLERCGYDVVLTGGAPGARVVWDLGPADVPHAFARYATALDADGAARMRINALCGGVWLRPIDGACADGATAAATGGREGAAELRCALVR